MKINLAFAFKVTIFVQFCHKVCLNLVMIYFALGIIHWGHSKLLGSFIGIIQNCWGHLSVSLIRIICWYHLPVSFIGLIQNCRGHSSVSFIGVIQNCQCHSSGSFVGGNSRNTRLSGHFSLMGSFVGEN